MGTIAYTVTTKATPEQAFEYISDLTKLPAYVDQVSEVELKGDGRYDVTIGRAVMPDQVFEYELAERDPRSLVVAKGTHKAMDVVDRWELTPADGGTQVDYTGVTEFHGTSKAHAPLYKLFGNIAAERIGERLRRQLDAL